MKWQRAIVIWLLIAVAESVHGTLRRLFLVPQIGELPSHQIGVVVASAIIFTIAWLCIRWIGVTSSRELIHIGELWVVLTLIFEFTLGYLLGYSVDRMLSDYNIIKGGVMSFGLLFMLFAPRLAARARGILLS